MKACAVIPAYNEAARVAPVVRGVIAAGLPPLVVDDGSADATSEVALEAGATVIRLTPNQGKGVALKTAFQWAIDQGLDAVVTLDADGQHDPAEIPSFLEAARRKSADIVLGSRMGDIRTMPPVRAATNFLMSALLSHIAGVRIADSQSGYRLVRTRVLRAIRLVSDRYDMESEMLVRAARRRFRITHVPIRTIYTGGPSSIRPGVDTLRFLRLLYRLL